MTIVRTSIGGGTLLLSTLGLGFCLAGGIGVWMVKARVEAIGDAVFAAADESLVFVDAKVDRVKQALDTSRRRVSRISKLAERLRDVQTDVRKEVEPLLQALDDVFAQLKAAESWLDSSQAAAQGVARVAEAIVSSEYAATHEDSTGIAIAQRLEEISEKVADALARLQVLRREMIETRDTGRLAREIATRIVSRVADLDGRLAMISKRMDKFDARVASAKAALEGLGQRIHGWMVAGAVAISAICAWFAITQISMMGHGWRLMRRSDGPWSRKANGP